MRPSRSSAGCAISAEGTLAESSGRQLAADGTEIAWRAWRPSDPRLTLAVVHGHGEHSGRYAGLATAMGRHRVATFAMDVRGHGGSGGRRGHVISWDRLLDDYANFYSYVEGQGWTTEVVPLGHSVGGSILLSAVLHGRVRPKRFVVSSPALRVRAEVPAWKLTLGRVASSVVPTLALATELNADHISRDPAVVKAYREDPLVHDQMSARFYTEWQAANQEVLARAAEISVPFLVTHGADDRIIDPAGSEELYRRATVEGRRLILYPGSYHEPYNDLDREQVFADLAAWLGV